MREEARRNYSNNQYLGLSPSKIILQEKQKMIYHCGTMCKSCTISMQNIYHVDSSLNYSFISQSVLITGGKKNWKEGCQVVFFVTQYLLKNFKETTRTTSRSQEQYHIAEMKKCNRTQFIGSVWKVFKTTNRKTDEILCPKIRSSTRPSLRTTLKIDRRYERESKLESSYGSSDDTNPSPVRISRSSTWRRQDK